MTLLNSIAGALDRMLTRFNLRGFQTRRFRKREKYRADYQVVASVLMELLEFDSVYDVGCANGFLLDQFHSAGKRVAGIDLSPDIAEVVSPELLGCVRIGDFAEATGRSDLVCCVEVAEHLPGERSMELVTKLTSLAEKYIYFSAAPPGQLGYGHINCRPHEDWIRWFKQAGWTPAPVYSERLRERLNSLQRAVWLRRNSYLLVPVPRRSDLKTSSNRKQNRQERVRREMSANS